MRGAVARESMHRRKPGWLSAMAAMAGKPPPACTITAMSAFSAAAQNQLALPSASIEAACGVARNSRTPGMPFCFHVSTSAALSGFLMSSRPMTALSTPATVAHPMASTSRRRGLHSSDFRRSSSSSSARPIAASIGSSRLASRPYFRRTASFSSASRSGKSRNEPRPNSDKNFPVVT